MIYFRCKNGSQEAISLTLLIVFLTTACLICLCCWSIAHRFHYSCLKRCRGKPIHVPKKNGFELRNKTYSEGLRDSEEREDEPEGVKDSKQESEAEGGGIKDDEV